MKNRKPILTSAHFVQQYFQSFDEDPIMRDLAKEAEGDVDEKERIDEAGDNVVRCGEASVHFATDLTTDIVAPLYDSQWFPPRQTVTEDP